MNDIDDLYRLVWDTFPGPDCHQYIGTKVDIFSLHYVLCERLEEGNVSVYDMHGNEYEIDPVEAQFVEKE